MLPHTLSLFFPHPNPSSICRWCNFLVLDLETMPGFLLPSGGASVIWLLSTSSAYLLVLPTFLSLLTSYFPALPGLRPALQALHIPFPLCGMLSALTHLPGITNSCSFFRSQLYLCFPGELLGPTAPRWSLYFTLSVHALLFHGYLNISYFFFSMFLCSAGLLDCWVVHCINSSVQLTSWQMVGLH